MNESHLTRTIEGIWSRLTEAVQDPKHPWRMAALATAEPAVRMMVLRGADAAERQVTFFTDVRSHKIAALRADPRAECVFWSQRIREQARLSLAVEVLDEDAITEVEWLDLPGRSWLEYATVAPPGRPLAPEQGPRSRLLTQVEAQRNFCVLRCSVTRIDWMSLGPAGEHVRARFTPSDAGWDGVHVGA